ncbi:MAG: N-acetyl-gamma-glutamyl-phosphate reductase [bacterium]|nr:N-acetyl-gamma-glutamyl-phosphate reductase [bacterium]
MIKASIIGAASYTAGELIKILLHHPEVTLTYLESSSSTGKTVDQVHPILRGLVSLPLQEYDKIAIATQSDVVFICRSAGGSMKYGADLLRQSNRLKIIDIGSDFRLKEPSEYKQWYQYTHEEPNLLKQSVYGLPELNASRIKKARLIANPGCYATSIILGLAPVVANHLVQPNQIYISAYSGISGAGRTYKPGFNMFLDLYGNIRPYKVAIHQHTPEIEQELTNISKQTVKITFIPHVIPIDKGILSTIFVKPKKKIKLDSIVSLYTEFYKGKPFIRIYPQGEFPQVVNVVNTNFCDIGLGIDQRTGSILIFSAIDNTIKGAGGQAVQNMNIMFGLKETTGLL